MASSEIVGMLDATQLDLLKGTEAVTIVVGSHGNKQTWTVQKRLITAHSTFFNACLAHTFREAASNTVSLPEDEPEIFETFIQYLYTGAAAFPDHTPIQVAKAWFMEDELGCPVFVTQAVRRLVVMHRRTGLKCTPELVRLIFKSSLDGSDIQKFVTCQFLIESLAGLHVEAEEKWRDVLTELSEFDPMTTVIRLGGGLGSLYTSYRLSNTNYKEYYQQWMKFMPLGNNDLASLKDPEHSSNEANSYCGSGKRKKTG